MTWEEPSGTKPSSALGICCVVMVTVVACMVLCCMLLDRVGFVNAGFGLLILASLPLMLWMFAGPNKPIGVRAYLQSRWGFWLAVGLWSIHSFLMLLAAQRFLV